MKRKYRHQTKILEDDRPLTLGDGIPMLRRTILETGPSIPSNLAATFDEAAFGLLAPDDWEHISSKPSCLFPNSAGYLVYSSERDIAFEVKSFVSAMIRALGLDDAVELHAGMDPFQVRHDVWRVVESGVPIGIIYFKKPNATGSYILKDGMTHPNILGEMYDLLKELPNYHDISPCFGILTNLNSWRVVWLPGDEADAMASEEEGSDDGAEDEESSNDHEIVTPVAFSSQAHFLELDNEEDDSDQNDCDEIDTSPRHVGVSRVFDKSDTSTFVRAMVSAILKMLRMRVVHPLTLPWDRLSERTLLKFEKGGSRSLVWTRFQENIQPDCIANPKKFLFAIQDLGQGAQGRVWLTCSSTGALCVLKFTLSDKLSDTLAETKQNWIRAYPDIPGVEAEMWCGQPALRMPWFSQDFGSYKDALPLVRKCLLKNFAERGLVHEDVEWRNLGFYKNQSGEDAAVVFDLVSVRQNMPSNDLSWVNVACQKLASTMNWTTSTEELS